MLRNKLLTQVSFKKWPALATLLLVLGVLDLHAQVAETIVAVTWWFELKLPGPARPFTAPVAAGGAEWGARVGDRADPGRSP